MLRGIKEKSGFLKKFEGMLSIASAILLAFSFPSFNLSFLAWISFVPLFIALEDKNLPGRFLTGYLWGIIFFSAIFYWLKNVSYLGGISLVLILSLFPAIFSSYKIRDKWYTVYAVPALWTAMEFARSTLFTGFPWALAGHSQYQSLPIIQIADYTGVYGISFLILLVNFSIYSMIKKYSKAFGSIVFTLVFLVVTYSYGYYRLKENIGGQPLKISVLQGNIPQENKWDSAYRDDILEKYKILTIEAGRKGPDLIVWPETSLPGLMDGEGNLYGYIKELAGAVEAPFIVGAVRQYGEKYYNSAYMISNTGEILAVYDKLHLVPFGEYIPFEKSIPWFRNMIDKTIGDFDFGRETGLFSIRSTRKIISDKEIVRSTNFLRFGVLICFEDIFPYLSRNLVKKGSDFLINITNDAWFGKTSAPLQHVQSSVFRAVENRVPLVRAANTGVSCFIDQKGRITSTLNENGQVIYVRGVLTDEIKHKDIRTYYTQNGDVFAFMCFGIVLLGIVLDIKEKLRGSI